MGEKINAGVRVAAGVVLVLVGVECGAFGDRKLGEDYFSIDVEDLVGLAVDVEDLGAVCSMSAAE